MKPKHKGRYNSCVCVCLCVCVCVEPAMSTLECIVFQKIILRSSVIIILLCMCVSIGVKIACSVFVMTVPLSTCISTAPTVGISVKFDF